MQPTVGRGGEGRGGEGEGEGEGRERERRVRVSESKRERKRKGGKNGKKTEEKIITRRTRRSKEIKIPIWS